MQSLFTYVAPPSRCGYLPAEEWSLYYEMVEGLTGAEYLQRMLDGWRRFGNVMFRPRCPACEQCRSLRVDVSRFAPNRSQRRTWDRNASEIDLRIGPPTLSRAKLNLYDRYHAYQAETKGWPEHPPKDAASYRESFIHNPPFTEEWTYYLDGALIGVGYIDRVPGALSAVYFFYDPAQRSRSLGIFNILCALAVAKQAGLRHLYLGYYVTECPSLTYKAGFRPNEIREPNGVWRDFA